MSFMCTRFCCLRHPVGPVWFHGRAPHMHRDDLPPTYSTNLTIDRWSNSVVRLTSTWIRRAYSRTHTSRLSCIHSKTNSLSGASTIDQWIILVKASAYFDALAILFQLWSSALPCSFYWWWLRHVSYLSDSCGSTLLDSTLFYLQPVL